MKVTKTIAGLGLALGLLAGTPGKSWGLIAILNVPLYAQQTGNTCWAACDQMVRAYFSDYVSQCSIVNFGLKRSDCCLYPNSVYCNQPHWSSLLDMPWAYFTYTASYPLPFAGVKQEISYYGRPLLAGFAFAGGGGHMRVVSGVSDEGGQWLLHNDPLPANSGSYIWIAYSQWSANVNKTYFNIYRQD